MDYLENLLFASTFHFGETLGLSLKHGFLLGQLSVVGLRLVAHLLAIHLRLLLVRLLDLLSFSVHLYFLYVYGI